MRNVTISLNDDTARWARVRAAEADKSLSRFIADLIERERSRAADSGAAVQQFLARPTYPIRQPGEPLPKREELYDRPGLR
jgi:hypothetical protein